jgi:ribosomal protein S18 acetylase RimI-like enzyme
VEARLEPFDPPRAELILGWIRSPEEADAWATVADWPLEPEIFARWHADPDVRPYVFLADGEPAGYGELWLEPGEAELARIVVDPGRRGRGLGRRLVELLVAEAAGLGLREIWLRVVPENAPALACYRSAGFVRASEDEETEFNKGQPRAYVWMRPSKI